MIQVIVGSAIPCHAGGMLRFLLLVLLMAPVMAQPRTFPGQPFHELQVTFEVTGAQLDIPRDHLGAELAQRLYEGTFSGAVTITGTATAGDRSGRSDAILRAKIFVDDRPVQTFERKLYENGKVEFTLSAPAGAKRSVEFFIHISEGGEDGVRVKARLLAGRSAPLGGLERILQLYARRIPRGLVSSGRLNNILSVPAGQTAFIEAGMSKSENPYIRFRCGGYQKQVLDFLDDVRLSRDPAERALLDGFDYGPIEGSCGFHQAVVIYPSGTDWEQTGIVLDPWPNQRPEHVSIGEWAARFRMAQPSGEYAREDPNFPLYGRTYLASRTSQLSPEEKRLVESLKTLSPAHYAYQAKLSPENRKAWVRGALERFKTRGHVFVECPVEARLVDSQGRFTGLRDGQLAAQIPGTTVILLPLGGVETWTELGYSPAAGLKLQLTGTGSGEARVTVVEDTRARTFTVTLQAGETSSLELGTRRPKATKREPVVLYDSGNPQGVLNGPPEKCRINLSHVHLSGVSTYHYNSARGAPPGTISLLHEDSGRLYGPWAATGSPGQGGVPNAFWTVRPEIDLPNGVYEVIVSDPASWSYNQQSDNAGFVTVTGWLLTSDSPDSAGRVWHVIENGSWRGTWTRRAGTFTFDAVWRHPNGAVVKDVLEVESSKGDRIVFYRRGNRGRYTAVLSADGRTAQGTMSWNDGGNTFKARIDP